MRLRGYQPGDDEAIADVWFAGWCSAGISEPAVSRADLAARAPLELADRWTVTVAEVDGRLAGFLATCLAEGRLDQLFIHPDFQGRGLGRALFQVGRSQLGDRLWLSTTAANKRACAFYEHLGLVLDRTEPGRSEERRFYVFRPTARE